MNPRMGIFCDFCGKKHLVDACSFFESHLESEIEIESLAKRTLPKWVSYLPSLRGIIISKSVNKGTKLGPLLAPFSASVNSNNDFPLKIFVSKEVSLWIDHSDENKCCWLSLIRACAEDHNLYACQMGESLYYIALKYIAAGSELKVWYAPFYKQRLDAALRKETTKDSSILICPNEGRLLTQEEARVDFIKAHKLSDDSPLERTISPMDQDGERDDLNSFPASEIGSPTSSFSYYSNIPPYLSSFATSLQRAIAIQDETVVRKSHDAASCSPSIDAPQRDEHPFTGKEKVSKSYSPYITITSRSSSRLLDNSYSCDDRSFSSDSDYQNSSFSRASQGTCFIESIEKISVSKKEVIFTFGSSSKLVPLISRSNNKRISSTQNMLECISIKVFANSLKGLSRISYDNEIAHEQCCTSKQNAEIGGGSFSKSEDGSIFLSSEPMESLPAVSIEITPLPDEGLGGKFFSEEITSNLREEKLPLCRSSMEEEEDPTKCRNFEVSCLHCNKSFRSNVSLATHLKEHLLFILKRIVFCKACNVFVYNSNTRLRRLAKKSQNRYGNDDHFFHDHSDNFSSRRKGPLRSLPPLNALSYLSRSWIGPYCCQICDKTFDKAQYLLRHLAKHLGDFSCKLCDKEFARKESLLKHNSQVHTSQTTKGPTDEGFTLTCDLCNLTFTQLNYYRAHCSKHEGPSKCGACGRFFSSPHCMARHKRNCTSIALENKRQVTRLGQKAKYRCDFCNQKYSIKVSFEDHVTQCKQLTAIEQKGEVSCAKCGHFCRSATEFRLHYQSHTHPYSCLVCSNKFKSKGLYEVHICAGKFVCDKCKEVFNSIQGLNRHLSVHEPPSFSCKVCHHPFYRAESLSRHRCKVSIAASKTAQKKFQCPKCLSLFSSNYNMKKHLASSHNVTQKQFTCSKCEKKFHRSDLLKDHEKIHLAPSFSCLECSKVFKSKSALRVHSTLHREDFRFLCRYCNKGFSQKTNLNRHEKSHAPVGSVKCQHCGIRCRSTQHLETHLLSHTNLARSPLKKGAVLAIGSGRRQRETKRKKATLSLPLAKIAPFQIAEVASPLETHGGSHIIHEIELTESPTVFFTGLTSLPLPPIDQPAPRDPKNEFSYEGSINLKLVSSE